jgi:hypothetical protein
MAAGRRPADRQHGASERQRRHLGAREVGLQA